MREGWQSTSNQLLLSPTSVKHFISIKLIWKTYRITIFHYVFLVSDSTQKALLMRKHNWLLPRPKSQELCLGQSETGGPLPQRLRQLEVVTFGEEIEALQVAAAQVDREKIQPVRFWKWWLVFFCILFFVKCFFFGGGVGGGQTWHLRLFFCHVDLEFLSISGHLSVF